MITKILLSLFLPFFLLGQTLLTESFNSFFIDSSFTGATALYRLDTANSVVLRDYAGANDLTASGTIVHQQGSISYSGGYRPTNFTALLYYEVTSPATNFNPGTNDFSWFIIFRTGTDVTTGVKAMSHYIHTNSGWQAEIASSNMYATTRVSPTSVLSNGSVSASTSYVMVAKVDRSDSITVFLNNVILDRDLISGLSAGSIAPTAAFRISNTSEGSAAPWKGSIEQVGFFNNKLLSRKEIAEIGYKPEGWVGFGADVTIYLRPNWQFALGFTGADTVYYGTALTAGNWSISIQDSAASGVDYKILTSPDPSMPNSWGTLAEGTTGTTWGTKSYSGTGSGYIGIAIASGTAYFDNLTVTLQSTTATGKFKGIFLPFTNIFTDF